MWFHFGVFTCAAEGSHGTAGWGQASLRLRLFVPEIKWLRCNVAEIKQWLFYVVFVALCTNFFHGTDSIWFSFVNNVFIRKVFSKWDFSHPAQTLQCSETFTVLFTMPPVPWQVGNQHVVFCVCFSVKYCWQIISWATGWIWIKLPKINNWMWVCNSFMVWSRFNLRWLSQLINLSKHSKWCITGFHLYSEGELLDNKVGKKEKKRKFNWSIHRSWNSDWGFSSTKTSTFNMADLCVESCNRCSDRHLIFSSVSFYCSNPDIVL